MAAAIDLVINVGIESDGTRRIRQVIRVGERIEGSAIETEMIFEWNGERYIKGIGIR